MNDFIKRYLNEIVGLAVMALLVVAFVDGQKIGKRLMNAEPASISTTIASAE